MGLLDGKVAIITGAGGGIGRRAASSRAAKGGGPALHGAARPGADACGEGRAVASDAPAAYPEDAVGVRALRRRAVLLVSAHR